MSFARRVARSIALSITLLGCAVDSASPPAAPPRHALAPAAVASAGASAPACAAAMTVRFYDVGQGLASLVTLPDGKLVLVDTGDNPARSEDQCHGACAKWHEHLMSGLTRDVGSRAIDLLWITHQHSDHLGGARDVLEHFVVTDFVDNGQEPGKAEVRALHETLKNKGVRTHVVGPGASDLAWFSSAGASLTAVVPRAWPRDCAKDPNDCSVGLRVSACASSVLFVGDAEKAEEALFDPGAIANASLLQVAHHGSDTSTTQAFLDRARPSYAVISSGKPDEGTNETYCHPRADVIARLDAALGDAHGSVQAHAGSCKRADGWRDVGASERLFLTARDGDVLLETAGDGRFRRR